MWWLFCRLISKILHFGESHVRCGAKSALGTVPMQRRLELTLYLPLIVSDKSDGTVRLFLGCVGYSVGFPSSMVLCLGMDNQSIIKTKRH